MERFQRSTRVAKFRGEPVEKFRMCRLAPHPSKIIERIYQSAPELMMPDAIYDAAPREGILLIHQPIRQRLPPCAFIAAIKSSLQLLNCGDRAGLRHFTRLPNIATPQNIH